MLISVNNKRKNDIYHNFKAAIVVLGTDKKVPLKSNPFYRDFEYRKHRKEYWDRNYASIQLEIYNDFFFTLFSSDVYQLVYELDHSQVCKRCAEDAHIIKHFNLNPGGAVLIVRNIIIKADFLGPFSHDKKLKPSDTCYHMFAELDNSPKGNESMPKNDDIDKPKFHNMPINEL